MKFHKKVALLHLMDLISLKVTQNAYQATFISDILPYYSRNCKVGRDTVGCCKDGQI